MSKASPPKIFQKAIALRRRRHSLVASTIQQYGTRFRGSLREIFNLKPKSVEGQRLLNGIRKFASTCCCF
ncbi:MAG: hypothetical protein KME16_04635 [Scytolyngbya sp. HA4215-MV1]|nr:hypothetical protein [Scytolyngbya sp. HA4215-MV1]